MQPLEEAARQLEGAGVKLAILFGSRATGHATASSDWDIGLLCDRPVDLLTLSAELGRTLAGRVDLVDLRRASPLLAHRAVTQGKLLVDRTGSEFARFASLALRKYWDTAKLRRAQEQSLRTFIAEHVPR